MMRQSCVTSLALAAALACVPAHAMQRAFVSSIGNDANAAGGCLLPAPCRSFQAAHGAVDPGGEIVALDAAGYGAVTITKSVSILGNPAFIAGISVSAGNGVTIATVGVDVVLRNLSLNYVGAGLDQGIEMTDGNSLTIENCVVSNFYDGLRVRAPARVRIVGSVMRGNANHGAFVFGSGASADVVRSQFIGNGGIGFGITAFLGGTTSASVSDSVASGNVTGFHASAYDGNSTSRISLVRSTASNNGDSGFQNSAAHPGNTSVMIVGESMASGNNIGFKNFPQSGAVSTFETTGGSITRQNNFNTSGIITSVPTL